MCRIFGVSTLTWICPKNHLIVVPQLALGLQVMVGFVNPPPKYWSGGYIPMQSTRSNNDTNNEHK